MTTMKSQLRFGNGSGHGSRMTEELPLEGFAKGFVRADTEEGRRRRGWVGTGALVGSIAAPQVIGLTPKGRKIAAGYMGARVATGAAGTGYAIANRKKTEVEKADWMNIEEHKRRGRDSRRTKSRGASIASLGTLGGSLILARKPRAIAESQHIVRVARGAMPMSARPGIGRAQRTLEEAKRFPAGAGLLASGGAVGAGSAMYVGGLANEKRHDRAIARQRRDRVVQKRDYRPEDRRQRRLGAASAALTIGGGVLGYKGVKRVAENSAKLRRIAIPSGRVVPKGEKNPHTTLGAKTKPFIALDRESGLYLGGSAAALGSAAGIRQHAEKRRGQPWD